MQVAVFCASSNQLAACYHEEAAELGAYIGSNGHTLVYGASNKGLMESVAKQVKASGGYSIGVLLTTMRKDASKFVDELFFVETLSERKDIIQEYADIFVVLPGGFGTLDELFDVLAKIQIGALDKKVLIINTNHFFDSLLSQIEIIYNEAFGKEINQKSLVVTANVQDGIKYLKEHVV